jgi:hypothetical protein
MKTKFSKVIYHSTNPNLLGMSHFSVGINLKTLILVGIVPGCVPYTKANRMWHAHFFVSIFTLELTFIL